MSDRVKINWNVPRDYYDRFLTWVAEKHGAREPYATYEIDEAVRELFDADAGAGAESTLRAWKEAAGHTLENDREKENAGRDAAGDGDPETALPGDVPDGPTVEVTRRIHPDLKERVTTWTREINAARDDRESKIYPGQVLAIALEERRGGGRQQRIADLADQLDDVVRNALQGSTAKDVGERKRDWLAAELRDREQFSTREFGAALEAMPFRGGDTEHMREKHLQPVLDRIGYVEDPRFIDKPRSVYVAAERAEEIARELQADRRDDAETDADAELATVTDGAGARDLADADRDQERADQDGQDGADADADPDADAEAAPALSTAQRRLMETIDGVDPDDPGDVRAFLGDDDQGDGEHELDDQDRDDRDDRDDDPDADPGDDRDDQDDPDPDPGADDVVIGDVDQDGDADQDQGAGRERAGELEPEAAPELTVAADGGVALGDGAPIPRVSCPCCGAIVPTHVDAELRGGRAVKECPTCRQPVDLETAATAVARDRARGLGDAPGRPQG